MEARGGKKIRRNKAGWNVCSVLHVNSATLSSFDVRVTLGNGWNSVTREGARREYHGKKKALLRAKASTAKGRRSAGAAEVEGVRVGKR